MRADGSDRLAPKKRVTRVADCAFALVSSRYRDKWVVLFDRFGRISDFIQGLEAVVARELNAISGHER